MRITTASIFFALLFLSSCSSTSKTKEDEQFENQFTHNSDLHSNVIDACIKKSGFEKRPVEFQIRFEIMKNGETKSAEIVSEKSVGTTKELEQCVIAGFKSVRRGDQIGTAPFTGDYSYRQP